MPHPETTTYSPGFAKVIESLKTDLQLSDADWGNADLLKTKLSAMDRVRYDDGAHQLIALLYRIDELGGDFFEDIDAEGIVQLTNPAEIVAAICQLAKQNPNMLVTLVYAGNPDCRYGWCMPLTFLKEVSSKIDAVRYHRTNLFKLISLIAGQGLKVGESINLGQGSEKRDAKDYLMDEKIDTMMDFPGLFREE